MATIVSGGKSPRELYRVAKKHGTWDPEQICVSQDCRDWQQLGPEHREQILKACSLFYEGEVSVADTLAWWLIAMPESERRMFLATQIMEEVNHADFFAFYFRAVLGDVDTSTYLAPAYRCVLVDGLRARGEAIGRALLSDKPLEVEHALVLGMAHYMGIVEGALAVTGYDYFDEMLGTRGIFPGLLEGIRLIRADEGRHVAHGMDYLRVKLAEKQEYRDAVAQLFFQESLNTATRADFLFETNAFGLDRDRMVAISMEHLAQRSREIGLA